MSKIQWTDATWNPTRGCTRVSPGCENCYAERQAIRMAGFERSRELEAPYKGLVERSPKGPRWTGKIRLVPEKLEEPLHWRKPRRVFTDSMSDLFHEQIPTDFLDRVFAIMALCPQHSFQVLTKRAERMREYASDPEAPFRVQRAMDAIRVDLEMAKISEQWRPVTRYEDDYLISNYGRVRSLKGREPALLKPRPDSRGRYLSVCLCWLGKTREHLVHRLVLEAFGRAARDGEEVRHANGDTQDNRIANLSWGTRGENMQDAARHGTAGSYMKLQANLDWKTIVQIRERRSAGARLQKLADEYGIDKRQVSAIARGKIYKVAELQWPLPNCWLGVSVEDQKRADERIPLLLQTPAAVRFLSVEPLLGPVELDRYCLQQDGRYPFPKLAHEHRTTWLHLLDWVIVGGESGPGARPCSVEWIRSVLRQCRDAQVPAFCKQLGSRPIIRYGDWKRIPISMCWTGLEPAREGALGVPDDDLGIMRIMDRKGGDPLEWPKDLRVREWPA